MKPEQEPKPQPLPIISNETAKILSEDFGLDRGTQRVIQGITPEEAMSQYEICNSQAFQVFTDVASVNPQFVETIYKRLANAKDDNLKKDIGMNAATVGMALVLRAFNIETNYDLISRFRNLQAEDINTSDQLLEKFIASSFQNILQQVLSGPKIPDQQISLEEIINKVARNYLPTHNSYYKRYVNPGASIMYKIIDALWPKLFPQGRSQTQ